MGVAALASATFFDRPLADTAALATPVALILAALWFGYTHRRRDE